MLIYVTLHGTPAETHGKFDGVPDRTLDEGSRTGSSESQVIAGQPLVASGTIRDVRFVTAGYLPRKTEQIAHRFALHAVGLVVSGKGTFQAGDGKIVPVLPSSVFFVRPGSVFRYGPSSSSSWEEYYIGVAGSGLARWGRLGWLPSDPYPRVVHHVSELLVLFRRVIGLLARGQRADADRAVLTTEQILLEVHHDRHAAQRDLLHDPRFEDVLAACRRNFAAQIDFKVMAREHGFSYSTLRERFRERTGIGPAHFLTALRCERARLLLLETNLSVKEIAARVGFPDPYGFSRVFTRTVGLSPSQFRQNVASLR